MTVSGKLQGFASIVIVFAFAQSPMIFAWILANNFENLQHEAVRVRIGTMYLGVNVKTEESYGISVTVIFLVRRMLFVLETFALLDHPIL